MALWNKKSEAYTLAEAMIAGGVLSLLGLVVFTVLNIGFTLYAQNFSINQTISDSVLSSEKLLTKISSCWEAPTLVNDTGAVVTGNGPTAGVRFFIPTSSQAYAVPSDVSATATSFSITAPSGKPAPLPGDKIVMYDLGFQGVVTGSTPSGGNHVVTFGSAVGSGFSPARYSGLVIPAGSKCFVLRPSTFISVDGSLRYYPRGLSVSADGASAFHNPANFSVVARLLPLTGQMNSFPFHYLDAGRASIEVTLRVRAPAHGSRVKSFYTFHNVRTTVAFRSEPKL